MEQVESKFLRIVKDNDNRFVVNLTTGGVPISLSSVSSINCLVKDLKDNVLAVPVISVLDAEAGSIEIWLRKDQTMELVVGQIVKFDLRLKFNTGDELNVPVPPFYGIVVGIVS